MSLSEMREQENAQETAALPGLDQNAFCQLYENCRQDMYRYAFYKLGSREDAEDAVQDAVLDAWRQLGNLRSVGAFRGWIFRILAACCNKRIRKIVRERDKTEAAMEQMQGGTSRRAGMKLLDPAGTDAAGSAQTAEAAGEAAERHVALEQALGLLAEDEREIVMLSVVAGLTSAEIAEQTGMQPGGVRSKLSRSLAKMREYLEE